MNTVTAGAWWLLSKTDMPYAAEWRSLRSRSRRCNLLLEGPEEDTDAVLALLKPHLREPILWQRRGAPLELPVGKSDTLILQDVAALGPVEQRRLIAWLDETGQFTQVVSTTTNALFPLVVDGLFDSALYYRLNVLLMHVDADTLAAARALSGNPAVPRSASRTPDPPVEARPS